MSSAQANGPPPRPPPPPAYAYNEDDVSSEMPEEPQGLGQQIPNLRIDAPEPSIEPAEPREEQIVIPVQAASTGLTSPRSESERHEAKENAAMEGNAPCAKLQVHSAQAQSANTAPAPSVNARGWPAESTISTPKSVPSAAHESATQRLNVTNVLSQTTQVSAGSWKPSPSMENHAGLPQGKQVEVEVHRLMEQSTADFDEALDSSCLAISLGYYTCQVVRHPCKFICLYSLALIITCVIGIIASPFDLDTDFSAFVRADGLSMRRREAYLAALSEKKSLNDRRLHENVDLQSQQELETSLDDHAMGDGLAVDYLDFEKDDASRGRRLQNQYGIPVVTTRQLVLTYVAESGDTLSTAALREISEFERGMRNLAGWKLLCDEYSTIYPLLCNPGETISAYAAATTSPPQTEDQVYLLRFDANGRTIVSKPAFLSYLQQSNAFHHDLRRNFPKTFELPPVVGNMTIPAASGLRSLFDFRMKVGYTSQPMAEVKKTSSEMRAKWDEFIENELYPYLLENVPKGVSVYYYGDYLTGYEINYTLKKDALWCIPSMCFVLVYLYFHTRSKLLTVACLCIIFSSVPLAYVMTPTSKVTIASFLSLFLITGIGSDVVFVFKDFWDRSATMTKKMDRRLTWTMIHAGKSCLATSLTTSVSFFANLASVLQPLREFGLFMGLCVMDAWLLVMLFLPPFFVIVENLKNQQRVDQISDAAALEGQFDDPEKMLSIVCTETQASTEQQRSSDGSDDKSHSCVRSLLLWLFDFVVQRPKKVLGFTSLLVLGFIISVAIEAEMAQGIPEVFPSDHNQVKYEEWQEKFYTVDDVKEQYFLMENSENAAACAVSATSAQSGYPCAFRWCETNSDPIIGTSDGKSGQCWRGPVRVIQAQDLLGNVVSPSNASYSSTSSTAECKTVRVRSLVAAPQAASATEWRNAFFAQALLNLDLTMSTDNVNVQEQKRLAIENWETGDVQMSNFFDMGNVETSSNAWNGIGQSIERDCEITTVCFLGVQKCELQDWQPVADVANLARRLEDEEVASADLRPEVVDPRRLQAHTGLQGQDGAYTGPQIPGTKQTLVTVLWGIRPPASTPLVGASETEWSFDTTYEPQNPWAQRAMLSMCIDVRPELQVISNNCWVNTFKDYLAYVQNDRFPTRNFDTTIAAWFSNSGPYGGKIMATNNLWMENRQVSASKVEFLCNFNKEAAASDGIKYKDKWNDYVDSMNAAASLTASHAYATADVFKRSEAEEALIGSTIQTIVIASVLAWLGCLVFTGSLKIACLVTGLVLGVVAGLAFFMVVLMDWDIGAIEVISLVVFMGYAVTYSLHIAHLYVEVGEDTKEFSELENAWLERERKRQARRKSMPKSGNYALGSDDPIVNELTKLRRSKTRIAVLHVGGATMSSAMSTLGSSAFLLFCTMDIFLKLGAVVIAVTLLSIIFALIPLQALLMLCGPKETLYQRFSPDRQVNASDGNEHGRGLLS